MEVRRGAPDYLKKDKEYSLSLCSKLTSCSQFPSTAFLKFGFKSLILRQKNRGKLSQFIFKMMALIQVPENVSGNV